MVEDLHTPEQLHQMHQQLWQCVLQFAKASAVQERHRIARDLHDSLGHSLTALNFQLQTAIKLCEPNPAEAQELLTEAHRLVAIATQDVRQSVRSLRSDAPETESLEKLLESLVTDFHNTTGITPSIEIHLAVAVPDHLVTALYRILQESLNNIRKYAQATAVQIHLNTTIASVHLMIRDNGRGFDRAKVSGGYGLQGMQERVSLFQGRFGIEAKPGQGCRITVEMPMQISAQPLIELDQSVNHLAVPQLPSAEPVPRIEIGEWQPLDLDRRLPQSVGSIEVDGLLEFPLISEDIVLWSY